MASFTSTFSFPGSPKWGEVTLGHPKAFTRTSNKTAFPRLSKPLVHFKRIYSNSFTM